LWFRSFFKGIFFFFCASPDEVITCRHGKFIIEIKCPYLIVVVQSCIWWVHITVEGSIFVQIMTFSVFMHTLCIAQQVTAICTAFSMVARIYWHRLKRCLNPRSHFTISTLIRDAKNIWLKILLRSSKRSNNLLKRY
jgi:hypothetical protein